MTETEVDEYKLNSTGREQSLRISIINNQKIAMIFINKLTNQRYSSYLTLQSLKELSQAFNSVKTIQEALSLLKNAIESGGIAITEDPKDSSISLNYEISLASGKYPEFEVNLTPEKNQTENNNNNNNYQEELQPTFDYQGNAAAEAKYGNTTKSTTEYAKPVIQSDVKPPIVQFEYIEPILQVHYPDGTTKSKALPPRIQGADGTEANISAEQFKLIQEEMNKNTFKKLSPPKYNNINRANSVTGSFKSQYSTQTMPYPSSNNMMTKNPFGKAVRPAVQNNQINNTNNVNQVRSAFTNNPNINPANINIQNKTTSDYSTMTMPYNRSYSMSNNEYLFQTPNSNVQYNFNNTTNYGKTQYMTQTHNVRNVVEERRPRMTHQNQNPYLQKNNNRSLSTPGRENTMKFDPYKNSNIYQQNITNYYGYQANPVYQQNNNINTNNYAQVFNSNINNQQNIQTSGLYYSNNAVNQNNSGIYNNQNQANNMRQIKPNNPSLAMQQSQELIQRHQKRLQEVQRQLALIQQQQQKLQEQQRQLMLQQQMQRQIIQKHTYPNTAQSQTLSNNKFKGFAQVSQLNNRNQAQSQQLNSNSQIRQAQTMMTNPPFTSQSSQEIKQTKTIFNQNPNIGLKTQTSTPISIQTPSLSNYQSQISQSQSQYSSTIKDEDISEQQIALAQMASMQNQENPEYQNLKAYTLQQREEEAPEVQEEAQEQVAQEQVEEQNQEQTQEQGEEDELNIEALFMTEEGRVIFRNGLLRGIIHKYAEIDDVISKIQDILLKGVKFSLVYKAFDVGDRAKTFHEKCDKLDMSLVLIETDKDVRFGGFTMKSWEGNNIKKKDNNAFVFSLETNSIFDIIKNEPAIGCYPKFGPVFFGCQIRIYDEFFTKGGTTCHKGLNYKTKKDYELNKGEQKYLIKDIEVYSIEAIDV